MTCFSVGGPFSWEYICQLISSNFLSMLSVQQKIYFILFIYLFFNVLMAIIQILGSVFGVMITLYSIHFKPSNHQNAVCFLLICDDTYLYCLK